MGQIFCKCCGEPVESIGPKPRVYCNKPRCRKRASRERIAEEKRCERARQQAALRARWRRFHPRVAEYLEAVLTKFGLEAATIATNAIELQCRTIQELLGKKR